VDLLGISELVPYVSGTVRVDIEGPGGVVLAMVTAGANAPAVTLLSPSGGGTLSGDPITVSWTASDSDGDALAFAVQYTPDGGATWQMVTQDITATSVQVPRANLTAGSAARFRGWASDGIHTTIAVSDALYTVPNVPPDVTVVEPAGNVTIVAGQTLALQALAYDLDTGNLEDAQIEWVSSLDGPLGTGEQFVATGLSVGTHTVTVTGSDADGGSASDSVTVTVLLEHEVLPPAPVFLPIVMR
jgi:hypothetical protein